MKFTTLVNVRKLHVVPFAAVLLLMIATVQAQTTPSTAVPATMPKAQMQGDQMGSSDMKKTMEAGMDKMQKMQMSGDQDKDFAMMMKIHHQQAVEMAQMELASGKSPAMKSMANKIIAAQKKEIAQFDEWLAKQK